MDGFVRFRYKDYAHGNRKRVMRLPAVGVGTAPFAARAAARFRPHSPLRYLVQSPAARKILPCAGDCWTGDSRPKPRRWSPTKLAESLASVTPTRSCPNCGAARMIVIDVFPPLPAAVEKTAGAYDCVSGGQFLTAREQ